MQSSLFNAFLKQNGLERRYSKAACQKFVCLVCQSLKPCPYNHSFCCMSCRNIVVGSEKKMNIINKRDGLIEIYKSLTSQSAVNAFLSENNITKQKLNRWERERYKFANYPPKTAKRSAICKSCNVASVHPVMPYCNLCRIKKYNSLFFDTVTQVPFFNDIRKGLYIEPTISGKINKVNINSDNILMFIENYNAQKRKIDDVDEDNDDDDSDDVEQDEQEEQEVDAADEYDDEYKVSCKKKKIKYSNNDSNDQTQEGSDFDNVCLSDTDILSCFGNVKAVHEEIDLQINRLISSTDNTSSTASSSAAASSSAPLSDSLDSYSNFLSDIEYFVGDENKVVGDAFQDNNNTYPNLDLSSFNNLCEFDLDSYNNFLNNDFLFNPAEYSTINSSNTTTDLTYYNPIDGNSIYNTFSNNDNRVGTSDNRVCTSNDHNYDNIPPVTLQDFQFDNNNNVVVNNVDLNGRGADKYPQIDVFFEPNSTVNYLNVSNDDFIDLCNSISANSASVVQDEQLPLPTSPPFDPLNALNTFDSFLENFSSTDSVDSFLENFRTSDNFDSFLDNFL